MKRIVGIFHSEDQAVRAIEGLKASGYTDQDISVITKDEDRYNSLSERVGTNIGNDAKDGSSAAAGAVTGGTIGGLGGLLLGLGALAIPGVGPIVAAGPIAAAVTGALAGGAVGGLAGALIDYGVPENEAKEYEERINAGDILVLVDEHDDEDRRNRAYDTFYENESTNRDTYRHTTRHLGEGDDYANNPEMGVSSQIGNTNHTVDAYQGGTIDDPLLRNNNLETSDTLRTDDPDRNFDRNTDRGGTGSMDKDRIGNDMNDPIERDRDRNPVDPNLGYRNRDTDMIDRDRDRNPGVKDTFVDDDSIDRDMDRNPGNMDRDSDVIDRDTDRNPGVKDTFADDDPIDRDMDRNPGNMDRERMNDPLDSERNSDRLNDPIHRNMDRNPGELDKDNMNNPLADQPPYQGNPAGDYDIAGVADPAFKNDRDMGHETARNTDPLTEATGGDRNLGVENTRDLDPVDRDLNRNEMDPVDRFGRDDEMNRNSHRTVLGEEPLTRNVNDPVNKNLDRNRIDENDDPLGRDAGSPAYDGGIATPDRGWNEEISNPEAPLHSTNHVVDSHEAHVEEGDELTRKKPHELDPNLRDIDNSLT